MVHRVRVGGLVQVSVICLLAAWQPGWGELRWEDLNLARSVTEHDWLSLKLEVLGQRLSFPAYRVHLELDADQRLVFHFLASSSLAAHLTKQAERAAAEEILAYHAHGIRQQVEQLLKGDFPALWERYDATRDFHGEFLGPGAEWDDPPSSIGLWRANELTWK